MAQLSKAGFLTLKWLHELDGWLISQAGDNPVCLSHESGKEWEFFHYIPRAVNQVCDMGRWLFFQNEE